MLLRPLTIAECARRSRLEHVLDRGLEQLRDPERELEARIVLFSLDRVHRLARNAELPRQVGLGPVALCAPLPQIVAQFTGIADWRQGNKVRKAGAARPRCPSAKVPADHPTAA